MLHGTAAITRLAEEAPTIPSWSTGTLVFEDVTVLQVVAEIHRAGREALLPAGLHPTEPAAVSIQAWRIGGSPWGPFSWAHVRLSCRSGVRARGFTTAAVASHQDAVKGLREQFGYPCRLGEVSLQAFYDGARLEVDDTLVVTAVDARPLGLDDVQYTGTMNLAQTPSGLRLVQVEPEHTSVRVDRVKARIDSFASEAWGGRDLVPYFVVAGSVARSTVEIPSVRFVCRPETTAFEGTEKVG